VIAVIAYLIFIIASIGALKGYRSGDEARMISLLCFALAAIFIYYGVAGFCTFGIWAKKGLQDLNIDIDIQGKPRSNRLVSLTAWVNWKDSIRGQLKIPANTPAYLSHHVLEANNQSARVRSSIDYYEIKLKLCLYVFGPLLCAGFILSAFQWLKYGLFSRFDITDVSFLIGLIGFGLCYLVPAPPAIVFDRKNRLVYTQQGDKVYIANWDNLGFSVRFSYYSRGLGVELYHLTRKGEWQSKWFTISTHASKGEETSKALFETGTLSANRWISARAWLLRYMELGPNSVHPVLPFKGSVDKLTKKTTLLPHLLEAKVLSIIGGQEKPPCDTDLPTKLSREVKQLLKRQHTIDMQLVLNERNLIDYLADNSP
jgi:hypothetical protein